MVDDDDLRHLVEINPGQGTFAEYRHLRDTIRARAPCNLLVFGVGKDSVHWVETNRGGRTVFLEHEAEWIRKTREQLPRDARWRIVQVSYGTRRSRWKKLLHRQERLFMRDLPNSVLSANWDVIYVDSPQGGSRKRPGRMKSIYTAAVLACRSTDVRVLVHDCDRKVERTYAATYLGAERLVQQVERLHHYLLRPTLENGGLPGAPAAGATAGGATG